MVEISTSYKEIGISKFYMAIINLQLKQFQWRIKTRSDIISGGCDRIITVKEMITGKTSILYDAKAVISNMKVPVVQNAEGVASTESALVWSEVSESIMKGDWNKAREAKRCVEEKHRKEEGRWQAKHFTISSSHQDSGEWVYLHRPQCVPPAPIILPPSPQR